MTFPNRRLRAGLGNLFTSTRHMLTKKVEDIRAQFEVDLLACPRATKEERISIRRMMNVYWENSSMFSVDLVGAVIRQGTFVQKMHNIDWLHSPTVSSTMERLIVKYGRFFQIMADYPEDCAVPTLDVDLAWSVLILTISIASADIS